MAQTTTPREGLRKDSATKGVPRLRRRFEHRPAKIIDAYVTKLRRELGVTNPAQFWQATGFAKKVAPQFGKLRADSKGSTTPVPRPCRSSTTDERYTWR